MSFTIETVSDYRTFTLLHARKCSDDIRVIVSTESRSEQDTALFPDILERYVRDCSMT